MTEHSSGTLTLRPARLMARLDYFEKFIGELGRLKRVFLPDLFLGIQFGTLGGQGTSVMLEATFNPPERCRPA
jgi:hypothetical protein